MTTAKQGQERYTPYGSVSIHSTPPKMGKEIVAAEVDYVLDPIIVERIRRCEEALKHKEGELTRMQSACDEQQTN